jgi:hypothetical protein
MGIEFVQNYDNETYLFKTPKGYFAKRGNAVTPIFREMDSLLFLLDFGKIRWQKLNKEKS